MTLGLISSNYEGIKPVVNVRMSPQSERSRQKRRFPNKQEVCIKASRQFLHPVETDANTSDKRREV